MTKFTTNKIKKKEKKTYTYIHYFLDSFTKYWVEFPVVLLLMLMITPGWYVLYQRSCDAEITKPEMWGHIEEWTLPIIFV